MSKVQGKNNVVRPPIRSKTIVKEKGVTSQKFDEDILICGLCSKWLKTPRTLPCLHSFCENCLERNISEAIARNGGQKDESRKKNEYECHKCKKYVTLKSSLAPDKWIEEFPINYFLMDLLDIELVRRGEKTCGPCSRNNETSDIVSWCKECRDGLCQNCAKVHKGMRVSMDHTVLLKEEFMKEMELLKDLQEPCYKHTGKTLDLFCVLDKELCCPNCVAEEHRRCDRVISISDAVKKSKLEKEPEFLNKTLEQYQNHIDGLIGDRSNHLMYLEEEKGRLLENFASIRINIINILDKLEKNLKRDISQIHNTEAKRLQAEMDVGKRMISAVTNAHKLMNVAEVHASDSRLLHIMEAVREQCIWYEEAMGKLRSQVQDCQYLFEVDNTLEIMQTKVKEMGKLSVRHSPSKLPPFPNVVSIDRNNSYSKLNKSTLSLRGKRAEVVKTFDARAHDDINDSWYTGAAFLVDGRLLLVDRQNKKIKLFAKNYRLLNSMDFASKPWDVDIISSTEVAVTLPEERAIQILNVDDVNFSLGDYFITSEACFGIKFVRGRFFTLAYDGFPPSLLILDSNGKELASVAYDDDGSQLFSRPIYITSNTKGSLIYVADERRGSVTTLIETAEHCYSYSSVELGHAAGLALDNEENLYVCRNHAKSVQVVSPEGDRVKTLISHDMISYPRAIAFDVNDERLLITQGDKSEVKIFQLVL